MAADIDDALTWSDNRLGRPAPRIALYWSMAGLAVLVGLLGLLHDSWLTTVVISGTYIHALFGSLLWGLVIARFYRRIKHSPLAQSADIREFSRHLSRMIYLLLYLLIGIKQIIAIVNFMWHGGTLDFGLLQANSRIADDSPAFEPTKDFRAVLMCGISALALVRVVAFWIWLRLVEEAAAVYCKSQYRTPCSSKNVRAPGPCNNARVESCPASVQVLAATVTERGAPRTGQPVRGSKMCP
jgi:cytochrome b561